MTLRFPCTVLAFLAVAALGCEADPASAPQKPRQPAVPLPEARRVPLGKGVDLETQGDQRRVLVSSVVCMREGGYLLECLLCRKNTKEHESILATTADARDIHKGLLLAQAEPGHPVKYEPKFQAPTGTRIRVSVQYEKDGQKVTVPAREWVRNVKTKKDLEHDWVFAGSLLLKDPDGDDKPPIYLANTDGALICTSNVSSAMLDLPINSPKPIEDRIYEPHTTRIPELKTGVVVILEPLRAAKPKK